MWRVQEDGAGLAVVNEDDFVITRYSLEERSEADGYRDRLNSRSDQVKELAAPVYTIAYHKPGEATRFAIKPMTQTEAEQAAKRYRKVGYVANAVALPS